MPAAKKVRAARHYQRRDAPLRVMADKAIPGIRRDIRGSLSHLSELIPPAALTYARSADWHGLIREVNWGHFRQILKTPFARIGRVRAEAAQYGVRQINGTFAQARRRVRFRKHVGAHPQAILEAMSDVVRFEKDVGSQFNFDLYDQDLQDRLREAQDELIQQLEADARDTIENVILAGAQAGLGPDEIVGDIRELIGLTDRQASAVMNYRSMLEDLDPGALGRALRNTAADDEIEAAIQAGLDLAEARIDQLVTDYEENYLDYRAETIARTEATRAVNAGLQDAYGQAIDRGVLPAEAVKQYWTVALDERTCQVCLSIPDMNPDGVAIGEMFDSEDGQMEMPPDPHPSCRCSLEIVTDLDMVPDDAPADDTAVAEE